MPGLSPILKTVRVTFLSMKLSSLSAWISTRIVSATFSSSSICGGEGGDKGGELGVGGEIRSGGCDVEMRVM